MKHLIFFLLLFTLISSACGPNDDTENPIPEEETTSPTYTYLALGDSYTIGERVNADERFPYQLTERLRTDGIDIGNPLYVARTGWTTDDLIRNIAEATEISDSTFDLVSLLIGVNNQYRNRPFEQYEPDFSALLQTAIDFAGGDKSKVFVVSIPDYAYTTFGQTRPNLDQISEELDAYNELNRSITEAAGIAYFYITDISREGLADPSLVATDGLHPSGEQYRRWIALMYEAVKNLLEL